MTLLSERDAARYLGIAVRKLYRLRCEGVVPAAGYREVRTAVYDPKDLDRYAEAIGRQRTYRLKGETVTLIYDEESP